MEILFITHKYPPSVGGMEKQSYELINGVARVHKIHTLIYDNHSSRVRFFLTAPWKARQILKKHPGISLIHLNDGLMAIVGVIIKRWTHRPVLATIHGLDIVFPLPLFQRFVTNHFKKLDGVLPVSHATAKECLDRGFSPEQVHVVRNGVDTDMAQIHKRPGFRITFEKRLGIHIEGKKIIVAIGRSVRRKGFSWFMTRVLPKLPDDVIFVIIGPTQPHIRKINFLLSLLPKNMAHLISIALGLGIDEIDIQNALERPEIKNRAFYMGKLPFEEMVQVLKHADLYVMPNIKVHGDAEGFGLVALEAAVSGVPVMASAVEGITCAVIDGKNGFLVPAEDPDIWVKKISAALSDREHLQQFGRDAQQYSIDNYSWKKMVEGYLDVFSKYNEEYQSRREEYRSRRVPGASADAPGTHES